MRFICATRAIRMPWRRREVGTDPELVESGMPNEEGRKSAMLNLLARGLPSRRWWPTTIAMAARDISVLRQRPQRYRGRGVGGGLR